MTTTVYLAARYSRREELCGYREDLHRTGLFTVTSRWLDGEHQISNDGLAALGSTPQGTPGCLNCGHDNDNGTHSALELVGHLRHPYSPATLGAAGEALVEDHTNDSEDAVALRTRFATEDWADLLTAEVVVSFTETPRASASRGGRHVEFGAALALDKPCWVVGPRENVFHCLPKVRVVQQWSHAMADLLVREVERASSDGVAAKSVTVTR